MRAECAASIPPRPHGSTRPLQRRPSLPPPNPATRKVRPIPDLSVVMAGPDPATQPDHPHSRPAALGPRVEPGDDALGGECSRSTTRHSRAPALESAPRSHPPPSRGGGPKSVAERAPGLDPGGGGRGGHQYWPPHRRHTGERRYPLLEPITPRGPIRSITDRPDGSSTSQHSSLWIPAFAGMTSVLEPPPTNLSPHPTPSRILPSPHRTGGTYDECGGGAVRRGRWSHQALCVADEAGVWAPRFDYPS